MSRTRCLSAVMAGIFLGWAGPHVPALAAAGGQIPDRLQEEASRPLRWIIESAKLERRKSGADNDAPSAPKAKPRPVERTARAAPVVEVPPPARAEDRLPALRPMAVSRQPNQETQPVYLSPPPRMQTERSSVPAQPPAAMVARLAPERAPVAVEAARIAAQDEPAQLVPIMQTPPVVWRGFCGADCEKYFYRVAFKVKPDGKVDGDSVRLVESNYPKLKRVVIDAVSNWRYMPMQAAQEEEVTLRISAQ